MSDPKQSDVLDGLRAFIAQAVRDELRALGSGLPDEYLSTREAAKLAKVAIGTIRRWLREGRLAPHHAGRHLRISRADLERALRTGRPRAQSGTPEQLARRDYG